MKIDNVFGCYPIFSPNEYMFNQNAESLKSLGRLLRTQNIEIDCIFGGFCKDDYWEKIIKIIKEEIKPYASEIKLFKFEKNFGKAYYVNNMTRKWEKSNSKEYMLTCDSDIIFKENEHNFIQNLIDCAKSAEKVTGKKTGMIAPNIEKDNGHWIKQFDNRMNIGKNTLSWASAPGGIQGCCLFISMEAWKKINGYQIIGVYGYDDAILIQDMYKHKFGYYVLENVFVIHPGTWDNKKYQDWKICYWDRQKGKTYRKICEETELFWSEME